MNFTACPAPAAAPPADAALDRALWHERSVRRAERLLELKRQRLRQDLEDAIDGFARFALPLQAAPCDGEDREALMREALDRLNDPAFAGWVMDVLAQSPALATASSHPAPFGDRRR